MKGRLGKPTGGGYCRTASESVHNFRCSHNEAYAAVRGDQSPKAIVARAGRRLTLPATQHFMGLSQIFGLHPSERQAMVLPLVSPGGHAAYAAEASVWWTPVKHESLTLSIRASTLFPRNFVHPDPWCCLSLKVSNRARAADGTAGRVSAKPAGSVTQLDAPDGLYNVFETHRYEQLDATEEYRNLFDAEFRPPCCQRPRHGNSKTKSSARRRRCLRLGLPPTFVLGPSNGADPPSVCLGRLHEVPCMSCCRHNV